MRSPMPPLALGDYLGTFIWTALTGLLLPQGLQVDIARHCHHCLDLTSRKYQRPPKTVCPPELSREALADRRRQLGLDWYLGLEVPIPQTPEHHGSGRRPG